MEFYSDAFDKEIGDSAKSPEVELIPGIHGVEVVPTRKCKKCTDCKCDRSDRTRGHINQD